MTTMQLRASLRLWKRRERKRKELHTRAQADLDQARRADVHPRQHLVDRRDLRSRQLSEARERISRREDQLAERTLSVIRRIPIRRGGYGALGAITDATVHHDAAPISAGATLADIEARLRRYDAMHTRLYGGGIGYHEAIDPKGRIWPLRSSSARGAHTGGHNTNNYGLMLLGNFETQKPTSAQLRTLRARLTQAPPSGLPDLRGIRVRGHQDWPGPTNATACPGRHLIPHVHRLPRYAR